MFKNVLLETPKLDNILELTHLRSLGHCAVPSVPYCTASCPHNSHLEDLISFLLRDSPANFNSFIWPIWIGLGLNMLVFKFFRGSPNFISHLAFITLFRRIHFGKIIFFKIF
jgi:hypothetical protein